MKLTNVMEHKVRAHLNWLRAQGTDGDETCWCPLCRSDMMALTLSGLPPRYATRRPGDAEYDPRLASAVCEAAGRARTQVTRFPKHPRGDAPAAGEPIWVVNFPLEEGFRSVEEIVHRHEGACDCWHCRCDMVAFALNRYPARYGVEHEGLTHLFEEDRAQIRTEIASFLDLAVRVVTAVPRHQLAAAAV